MKSEIADLTYEICDVIRITFSYVAGPGRRNRKIKQKVIITKDSKYIISKFKLWAEKFHFFSAKIIEHEEEGIIMLNAKMFRDGHLNIDKVLEKNSHLKYLEDQIQDAIVDMRLSYEIVTISYDTMRNNHRERKIRVCTVRSAVDAIMSYICTYNQKYPYKAMLNVKILSIVDQANN